MLRLSMSEFTTFRWTFEEDVQHYAAAGFEGIGVWRQKLAECGEERGVDLLCESGLAVSSLMWAGGFTGSDGRSMENSIEDGIEALRLAAALRAECLVVYTGGRGGHTHRHARRLAVTAMTEMAIVAEELDVQLAVEPMHPGCGLDWTFLSTIDSTRALLADVPSLQMVFDAYHWALVPGILDELPQLVPHIALVQLGDGCGKPCGEQDRRPLGEGHLPLKRISQTLIENGYGGFFEIELVGPEIETSDYGRLVARSAQALTQLTSGIEH
jgi:sugar phosphate isomerase/epimerase